MIHQSEYLPGGWGCSRLAEGRRYDGFTLGFCLFTLWRGARGSAIFYAYSRAERKRAILQGIKRVRRNPHQPWSAKISPAVLRRVISRTGCFLPKTASQQCSASAGSPFGTLWQTWKISDTFPGYREKAPSSIRPSGSLTGRVSEGLPFTDLILSQGFTPSVANGKVEKLPITPEIQAALQTDASEMYRVEKLFLGDGEPGCLRDQLFLNGIHQ